MRIDYHDMSDSDFERLVVAICAEILGAGVTPYGSGKDGSKDARFVGTAARFPSSNAPYTGKFIAQAKHTESPIAKFSDADFSSNARSSVISKECPGIKKLVQQGKLDHYLLFSNRKLTGVAEDPIVEGIKAKTGVSGVELFGIERMDLLLKMFPEILRTFGELPSHLPILVTCDAISEVILSISTNIKAFEEAFRPEEFERTSFKDKNSINGLSEDFARYIRRLYLPRFADVKKFLAMPENEQIRERYSNAAHEFHEQIEIHRKSYENFDHVLLKITHLLICRDGDLGKNRALTKLLIYYMYWNCDIGSKVVDNVEAE
jgi:hypothetical protein